MQKVSTEHETRGVHHIGLTVPNVDETTSFFVEVLGYELIGTRENYPAAFVSDGSTMITLWQAENPDTAVQFNRKTVIGLHHIAIAVADEETLDAIYQRLLTAPGVNIEFPPESQASGRNRHMMCTIPSGIRVELISAIRTQHPS